MTPSANQNSFLFDIPFLSAGLRVLDFKGHTQVCELFQCQLTLACVHSARDLESLIGKSGCLTLRGEHPPQHIHGEITAARYLGARGRFSILGVNIAPKIALLQYRINQRIFQDMTVQQIVSRVLDDAGIDSGSVKWRLRHSYQKRNYCTQYAESDWHFIKRLMEEEGLYFFFEHASSGHTLIICDNSSSMLPIAGGSEVRYRAPSGMVALYRSVSHFQTFVSVQPGKVTLRDYAEEKSRLRLQQSDQHTSPDLEHYHYNNTFTDPSRGQHLARVRFQALSIEEETVQGRSDCQALISGTRFNLAQHPEGSFNREYLILQTQFEGRQSQALEELSDNDGTHFSVSFRAIPAVVEFRAPLQTPSPTIAGTHSAIVTGPKGEEIYTDRLGRVKVQFHWDREGDFDEKSSCWVRVCQIVAGNQWGGMVLPRVGQEVLVAFINGNPDRPLIVGALYNGTHQPPVKLPQEKTKFGLKSMSSPGGGGYNEIRIEDKTAEERIFVHAEKNIDLFAQEDWREAITNQHHLKLGQHSFMRVAEDYHDIVTENLTLQVEKSSSETVAADSQIRVDGSVRKQVGRTLSVKAGKKLVVQAGVEITLKAGAGLVKLDPSGVTIKGPLVKINTGGVALAPMAASPAKPEAPAAADQGDAPGRVSAPAGANPKVS